MNGKLIIINKYYELTGDPDIDRQLQGTLRTLKMKQMLSWITVFVILVAGVWGAHLVYATNPDDLALTFLPLFAALGGAVFVSVFLRKTFSASLLPTVAKAVGFEYSRTFHGMQDLVDTGLLPRGRVARSEDRLKSDFGGVSVSSCNIHIKTGGKHPKTLFGGLVISLKHPKNRNWLVVTTLERTGSGPLGRQLVGTRNLIETARKKCPQGEEFSAFSSDSDKVKCQGLEGYLENILRLNTEMPNCRLFSLVRSWDETHVALSYDGNPMMLGGLFVTRSQLQKQVLEAVSDMQLVPQAVQIVLEAETAEKR
ncbi:hypothetical protein [Parasedimentitalea psychrophila]|uniref:DUF3137 domain-containing protein n=1 Tax=Parasedimentitalea psychrophila TaxID=2997337 RepID=A0A9Y2P0P9_9RHOB|nr:hypothetical protein [Parasedimentitalea psychrophila]WIY24811.1 hypothetical protein QPJ95_20290 [Parasedimentitalea psychrophila]